MFEGVSEEDFRKQYLPTCRSLSMDNAVGKVIFAITGMIQKTRTARKGLLRMTRAEQEAVGGPRRMSGVLWDTFTGSAPYGDVFRRSLHPMFLGRLLWDTGAATLPALPAGWRKEEKVTYTVSGQLGKVYRAGEIIVRQGEAGDCMYFIQAGRVEVIKEKDGKEVRLAELGPGEFFGEMALFEKDVRSATVRPMEEVRALSVDRKMFLRKIHDDPALAFRVMQKMSRVIRQLDDELMRLRSEEVGYGA